MPLDFPEPIPPPIGGDVPALLNLARRHGETRRFAEALACSERALDLAPGLAAAQLGRALALAELGRSDEALASYARVLAPVASEDPQGPLGPDGAVALRTSALAQAPGDAGQAAAPPSAVDLAQAYLRRARLLLGLERPAEALVDFGRALTLDPAQAEAWSERGYLLLRLGRTDEALACFERRAALQPDHAVTWNDRGAALRALGRPADALESIERAIALKPDHFKSWNNLGVVLEELGRDPEALSAYDQVIALQPDFAETFSNRALLLMRLGRSEEALASLDQMLALRPEDAEGWNRRSAMLRALRRPDEALASVERALALRGDDAGLWLNRAILLGELERHEEALASCERLIALEPMRAEAWFQQGLALARLGETLGGRAYFERALTSLERAIALQPEQADAYNNRGAVMAQLGRHEEALASFDQATALRPEHVQAHANRGEQLARAGRGSEAAASYARVLELSPDTEPLGSYLHVRMQIADWHAIAPLRDRLLDRVARAQGFVKSFPLLAITDSPALQRQAAASWSRKCHSARPSPAIAPYPGHDRLRLAYLSADFRDHPVSYLMTGLFEGHDRSRFHLTAFDFGEPSPGPVRDRVVAAFDRFIDVRGLSDAEAARLARELEIDIAIDLTGYTGNSRTGILAARAAPIQVNYLGYPGTLGVPFMDYILADRHLIPEELRGEYSEQVVYLPDCFQANSPTWRQANPAPTRAELGLPETGLVFCAFSNTYKITPELFSVWMRLLVAVPASVLWLVGGEGDANLRREAEARGVPPERLVFAPRLPYADYLGRYPRADLFLDTLPFNAGTTASDALWMGLPVLTCSGQAFAARMAGSLLRAIGLPELITANLADYEALALDLARNPRRLAALRQRLAANRLTYPLFDTDRFRRHLEAAYLAMWERYQSGEPPASFAVEPITAAGAEGDTALDIRASDDEEAGLARTADQATPQPSHPAQAGPDLVAAPPQKPAPTRPGRAQIRFYPPDAYDRNQCLMPSVGMILTLVYACRHLLLVFLSYAPVLPNPGELALLKSILTPALVLSDAPGLLMLLAWRNRQEGARAIWRWLWRHGRLLLLVTFGMQLALLLTTRLPALLLEARSSEMETGLLALAYLGLHAGLMLYLALSARVRDVFRDLPRRGAQ